jgi:2-polyprenyl-6-hydroxyphenyl methylase/3-demethylubiquinone-9 3-methyltransferase
MQSDLRRSLLALYDPLPLKERLFVRARLLLSDLDRLERYVPTQGRVLDLGCGHGLVANILALTGPARQVLGVDLDPAKIAAARQTIGARDNIDFVVGDAAALPDGPFQAVTIADVLYTIPPPTQRAIVRQVAAALEPGGVLVWKTQVRQPRWKYAITYGQEWLMTRLGPTMSAGLHFMDREESLAALRAAGLRPAVIPLPSIRPYTDILFLGYRQAGPLPEPDMAHAGTAAWTPPSS